MSEVAHELDVDGAQVREGAGKPWSVGSLLKAKDLRLNLALVCALQAGQQLSGINAVRSLFYISVRKGGGHNIEDINTLAWCRGVSRIY